MWASCLNSPSDHKEPSFSLSELYSSASQKFKHFLVCVLYQTRKQCYQQALIFLCLIAQISKPVFTRCILDFEREVEALHIQGEPGLIGSIYHYLAFTQFRERRMSHMQRVSQLSHSIQRTMSSSEVVLRSHSIQPATNSSLCYKIWQNLFLLLGSQMHPSHCHLDPTFGFLAICLANYCHVNRSLQTGTSLPLAQWQIVVKFPSSDQSMRLLVITLQVTQQLYISLMPQSPQARNYSAVIGNQCLGVVLPGCINRYWVILRKHQVHWKHTWGMNGGEESGFLSLECLLLVGQNPQQHHYKRADCLCAMIQTLGRSRMGRCGRRRAIFFHWKRLSHHPSGRFRRSGQQCEVWGQPAASRTSQGQQHSSQHKCQWDRPACQMPSQKITSPVWHLGTCLVIQSTACWSSVPARTMSRCALSPSMSPESSDG